jgi:hypothetical protein
MKISQPFLTQKGGPLLFDKHGYLLIGLGDGGSNGDPLGNGQDKTSLLGKMLRINVDLLPGQTVRYTIPSDNPFVNQTGVRKEIYALGLRNPWRCSYDSKDENIWCADVVGSSCTFSCPCPYPCPCPCPCPCTLDLLLFCFRERIHGKKLTSSRREVTMVGTQLRVLLVSLKPTAILVPMMLQSTGILTPLSTSLLCFKEWL